MFFLCLYCNNLFYLEEEELFPDTPCPTCGKKYGEGCFERIEEESAEIMMGETFLNMLKTTNERKVK